MAFLAFITVLLVADLLLVHRKPHAPDHQGGGHRVGGVDQHRRGLHGRDVRLARRPGGHRVHLGLPDREEPQRRQRVRVGAHHELLRGAPRLPVPGAVLGHLRRPRAALRVHLRRRRAARALRVDAVRVRGASCWSPPSACCATARRRGGAPGEQPGAASGAAGHTVDHRVQRPELFTRHNGQAAGHAAAGRAHRHRDERRGVRGRLDPRHPGRQPRAVHRVQLERLRHPRPAGALLPARRPAGQVQPAAGGPGGHPRLRGRQDDHRRVVPHPHGPQPGRHRPGAGRRHLAVDPQGRTRGTRPAGRSRPGRTAPMSSPAPRPPCHATGRAPPGMAPAGPQGRTTSGPRARTPPVGRPHDG